MRIEFDIPENHAASVAHRAALDGLTPTAWVILALREKLRHRPATKPGRPKINTERDKTIYAKRIAGATVADLMREHGLTEARIHQICRAGENGLL